MKIKKITAFLLGCVMAVALLSACAPDKDAEYTVSFDYNYFTFDEVPARQTVRYGEKAEEPEEPEPGFRRTFAAKSSIPTTTRIFPRSQRPEVRNPLMSTRRFSCPPKTG